MSKLIILLSNILDRPGVKQALERSQQDRYAITLCEMLPPNKQVEASLSNYISLMMANSQLSNVVLGTESGDHAYWLSQSNGFPSLHRLQRQVSYSRSADSTESWEKVDVRSFAKPAAGMVDHLEKEIEPTH